MTNIDSIFICSTENELSILANQIDSLQSQIWVLNTKSDLLMEIIGTSNDGISNQLSAASILLAIIAIVIAFLGGALGFYIRKKKLEIDSIAETIEEKKKTIDSVADATEKLDLQIKGNLGDLYLQLRDEETKAILDRLILEPRDISNLIQQLLARDLEDEGFPKLREAYLKYKSTKDDENQDEERKKNRRAISISLTGSYDDDYLLLFFQHYCCQAVQDDDIRPELVSRFVKACDLAFKRDIIKTTIDLCRALTDERSTFSKEDVLVEYLNALNESKHRRLADLKNILEQNIQPDILLKKAIERCTSNKVYLTLFGIAEPTEE